MVLSANDSHVAEFAQKIILSIIGSFEWQARGYSWTVIRRMGWESE